MADFAFLWRIPRGDYRVARVSVKLGVEEASLTGRAVTLKAVQRRGSGTISVEGTPDTDNTVVLFHLQPEHTDIVGVYDAAIKFGVGPDNDGPYTFTGQIEIYDHVA